MGAESNPETVRGLQERAARALPATTVKDCDGWWLRASPGCAWWVETVLPHADPAPGDLVRRVISAETFCADRGVTTRFQMTPGACPPRLDAVLAERGYRPESPMSLQAASTTRVRTEALSTGIRVRLDDHPTGRWFDVWDSVHGRAGASAAEWAMLGRVTGPCAYASAMLGGAVVAVGRAVADTGWAGLFGMATLPEARGLRAARGVLTALAEWAGDQRADHLYLQVERANTPALGLYERAGFSEVAGYHYRSLGH
ncbi:GNAT family N-acetyltransferase [Micromonospora sp. CPCC 205539]|uniref:GNAT family N-acetyltransferase n=1 Tax=Micromonospora sp. CPCC 205539 TaxID=3122408 RepID=UPI002FF1074F